MPSPLVAATSQATALACVSNILAQILDHWQQGRPQSFSLSDFLRFMIVTVLTAPPNFMWQAFLERTFPGRIRTEDHDILLAERGDGDGDEGSSRRHAVLLDPIDEKEPELRGANMRGDYAASRLDWKNTMIKWFIDCITVGALLNTVAFLVLMGMLKFRSVGDILASVQNETIGIIVAGYKIWPIASILSFTLIPVEKRIVFLSAVGLFWGIYMSLVAARQ